MVRQTQLFELQSEKSTQKLTFYSSLEKLNQACLKCDRCSLSQKRKQVVIGRGKIKPDLAVIGEAPGKLEDHAGQPFVGDSGSNKTRQNWTGFLLVRVVTYSLRGTNRPLLIFLY